MKTKKSEYVERFTVGVNDATVNAIRTSGESAPGWLRQAARIRLESERGHEVPTNPLDQRLAALERRIEALRQDGSDARTEIAQLQPSNAILQAALAETRKALMTIQHNQAELQRTLIEMEKGIGHALATLGPTLLAALSQQLHPQWPAMVKTHEEPPKRPLPPVLPRTRL